MERDVPYFANDSGAPILAIGARELSCVGESPPFDHPHIYLTMRYGAEVICPYCATVFRHDPSIGQAEAYLINPPSTEPEEGTPGASARQHFIMPREPTPAGIIAAQIKRRATNLARTSGRFFGWLLLILAIELPIAVAFEWIAGEDRHWLQSLDAFQKSLSDAVNLVRPW